MLRMKAAFQSAIAICKRWLLRVCDRVVLSLWWWHERPLRRVAGWLRRRLQRRDVGTQRDALLGYPEIWDSWDARLLNRIDGRSFGQLTGWMGPARMIHRWQRWRYLNGYGAELAAQRHRQSLQQLAKQSWDVPYKRFGDQAVHSCCNTRCFTCDPRIQWADLYVDMLVDLELRIQKEKESEC